MKEKYLPLEDLTRDETIETLHLALKEAKQHLTPVELAQEIMRVLSPQEVKDTLAKMRKGEYF